MFEITRPGSVMLGDIDRVLGRDAGFDAALREFFGNPTTAASLLPLDISDTANELVVRASLPGFTREEIEITFHEGVLAIKAERTSDREEAEKGATEQYYRRERTFGAVSRRVKLPERVDTGAAKAELKDGVLTLRLPHSEAAKPKAIQIS